MSICIDGSELVGNFDKIKAQEMIDKESIYLDNKEEVNYNLYNEKAEFSELKLFSDLRFNLLGWMPFSKDDIIAIVGADAGVFSEPLSSVVNKIYIFDNDYSTCRLCEKRLADSDNVEIVYRSDNYDVLSERELDYIILSDAYTISANENINSEYINKLEKIRFALKENGKIIGYSSNSFGLKYWAGCKEDIENEYYRSIEGYVGSGVKGVPSLNNISELLAAIGLKNKIYYPYPDMYFPMSIYSDDFLPGKNELTKNAFSWEERIISFNEVSVWNNLIKNNMFKFFSNAFLFVATNDENYLKCLNIYTKYSNDRDEKFAIRTDISIDINGVSHIKKIPCSKKSEEHLKKMEIWQNILNDKYSNSNISINKIINSDNIIEFEYIQGTPFLEKLEQLLAFDKYDEFLIEFKKFTDILIERNNSEFEMTDGFRNIFGNIDVPAGLRSGKTGNIDLILSNILCIGEEMTIIDYEWMFDFPIPINFMIYRSIDYLFKGPRGLSNFNPIYKSRLLDTFMIDEEQQALFDKMEHNFQEYVRGKRIPMRMMNRVAPISNIQKSPLVFLDFGKGFSRANSFAMNGTRNSDGFFKGKIGIPYGVKRVRIDPTEDYCIVEVISMTNTTDGVECRYRTNGKTERGDVTIFNTIDPQIIVAIEKGMMCIDIEMIIKELPIEMIEKIDILSE